MTNDHFGHQVQRPGNTTEATLADLLQSDGSEIAERLRKSLDRIRESEREAEKASAEVRLY